MKLSLAFSPCPNDTFIFDALVNKRISAGGLQFDPVLEDVETLNEGALAGKYDICKVSIAAFAHVSGAYRLLQSGSALGRGCGPLLIAREMISREKIPALLTGIPGKYTTARLLLHLAFPKLKHTREMLFSAIEQALLDRAIDVGLIIHENRFTYAQKGLVKLMDLGDWWEEKYKMPVPLGGIAIRRTLSTEIQHTVNALVRQSVQTAFADPGRAMDYVRMHAQTMDPDVMRRHIDLYVNDYTTDLGAEGRRAIELLFAVAAGPDDFPAIRLPLFVQ